MGVVIPDVGKNLSLQILYFSGTNPKVRLFTNAHTFGFGTVLSNLTEAAFDGYAPIDLSSLSSPAINLAHASFIMQSPLAWTKAVGATPQNVTGWYLTLSMPDGSGTYLLLGESYVSPVPMLVAGQQVLLNFNMFTKQDTSP